MNATLDDTPTLGTSSDSIVFGFSPIIQVSHDMRKGRIASIYPISVLQLDGSSTQLVPAPFQISSEIAGYIAMREFNQRSGKILPELPQLIGTCNLQLDTRMYDSTQSPIVSALAMHRAIRVNPSVLTPFPMAVIGSLRSAVTGQMAILSGALGIPQISPGSTSAELDNKDIYPYFGRTIPSNLGDAYVLVSYLISIKVKYVGIIYVQDPYGVEFVGDIQGFINVKNSPLKIAAFSYDPNNEDSIKTAVKKLADTNFRYFFGALSRNAITVVLKEAQTLGIIGTSEYAWILSETSFSFTSPDFSVADKVLYEAIDGIGIINLNVPQHPPFTQAMNDFAGDQELQGNYILRHDNTEFLNSYNLSAHTTVALSEQQLYFDAVISLGLAACNVSTEYGPFFSGPQLYNEWLRTEFLGVSGKVQFDPLTGTRTDGVEYGIFNIVADPETSKSGDFRFSSKLSISVTRFGKIRTRRHDAYFLNDSRIEVISPFVYADGSTVQPEGLPPLKENMNLISPGILTIGLFLAAFVILSSVWWIFFTCRYKDRPSVRAAQPFFLHMNVVGTFIMGASIIPTAMQYPVSQSGLDFACMAYEWLFSIGFVTSFSAIYCKARRLNRLMKSAKQCRRVIVKPKDVLVPFFILMALNLVVLITWSTIDPLVSTRIHTGNSVDEFGRLTESIATCASQSKTLEYTFQAFWYLNFFCAVIVANYETYQGRNHPTEFNDSKYVAISMALLLEAIVVSLPALLLVKQWPSAFFLIRALFVAVCAIALSFPLFLQKYRTRHKKRKKEASSRIVMNASNSNDLNSLPTATMNDVKAVKEGIKVAVSSVCSVGVDIVSKPNVVASRLMNTFSNGTMSDARNPSSVESDVAMEPNRSRT